MKKRIEVQINFDYTSGGFMVNHAYDVAEDYLPDEMAKEFERLQKKYDEMFDLGKGNPSKNDIQQFKKESEELYKKVKDYLDPEKYEVSFLPI